jgi:hypothetical protein
MIFEGLPVSSAAWHMDTASISFSKDRFLVSSHSIAILILLEKEGIQPYSVGMAGWHNLLPSGLHGNEQRLPKPAGLLPE